MRAPQYALAILRPAEQPRCDRDAVRSPYIYAQVHSTMALAVGIDVVK